LHDKHIYYDAGVLDATAWDVAAMDIRLRSLGVPHVSHLYVGYHDWPFWRQRLAVALPVITAGFARAEQALAQKP
jgi:S-formylglutathione hydrolase FrmB